MFKSNISRSFLLFLLVSSCSTKEQPAVKHIFKQQAITTFEEQETEPKDEEKKPSKRIYESYIFKKLSNSFDFRIRFNYEEENYFRIGIPIYIDICHKKDSIKQQTLLIETESLSSTSVLDCVFSYETSTNIHKSLPEETGFLIVGDFNFDSLVDFMVLNNVPQCSGTASYSFYLQQTDSTFKFSREYTNQVCYFPTKLNNKKRTFEVESHTGCCYFYKRTFNINENGEVRLIRYNEIDGSV